MVEPPGPSGGSAADPPQFGSKAVHFAMDVEDQLSQSATVGGLSSGQTAPPGFSGPQGWQPRNPNGASWGSTWQPRWSERSYAEFQVELRNWKAAPLDLTTKPESFLAWQHRAVSVLSGNRVDIRRLLDWTLTC